MRDLKKGAVFLAVGMVLLASVLCTRRKMAPVIMEEGNNKEQSPGGPGEQTAEPMEEQMGERGKLSHICVVLDAGHGGEDPGKVGVAGTLEKEINLEIVLLLKKDLEESGIRVVLTREGDEGLWDPDSSDKKRQDLRHRVEKIEHVGPDLTVSIHQNSFPDRKVHGAQVFYYTGSEKSGKLAAMIQEKLIELVDPENTRNIKEDGSYYLLKKTGGPIVIVECGFLSNPEEEERLQSPGYREKLAEAIREGILEYLEREGIIGER